jgi:hypothetical protein
MGRWACSSAAAAWPGAGELIRLLAAVLPAVLAGVSGTVSGAERARAGSGAQLA